MMTYRLLLFHPGLWMTHTEYNERIYAEVCNEHLVKPSRTGHTATGRLEISTSTTETKPNPHHSTNPNPTYPILNPIFWRCTAVRLIRDGSNTVGFTWTFGEVLAWLSVWSEVQTICIYIGWQWRNFFILYLGQLFFRHVVGQALQNVSYSDITLFVR